MMGDCAFVGLLGVGLRGFWKCMDLDGRRRRSRRECEELD